MKPFLAFFVALGFCLGSIAPGDVRANVRERPGFLVGWWACLTNHRSSTTKHITFDADGGFAVENFILLADNETEEIDEAYRYDPATFMWSVSQSGIDVGRVGVGGFTGTAPRWTGSQWVFEGTEPRFVNHFKTGTVKVRMVYTDLSPQGFRREFQERINSYWRDVSDQICRPTSEIDPPARP